MRSPFGELRNARVVRRRASMQPVIKRQRFVLGVAFAVIVGAMALSAPMALAAAANTIGDPSGFELADGNMTVDGTGTLDWNCLTTPADLTGSTGSCGTNDGSYVHYQDKQAGTSGNLAWVSGQKQDVVCPQLTGSSNPAKDTFTDVASYNDTNTSTLTSKIDTFLYGATVRSTSNGTASENIELQQGTSGLCSNEPTGVTLYQRTPGDKLIAISYNGGGANATFNVLTWIASGTCFDKATAPCWGPPAALNANSADGETNANTILQAADGIQLGDTAPAAPSSLVAGEFAEFGIDLSASGVVSQTSCTGFAQTLWESRSSTSFTSNPEDIEIEPHQFSSCQPAQINVVKLDSNTSKGIAGAVFSLFAGNPASGSALATCTTNASGDCDFPGLTGTGTSSYTVEETTAPNGYTAAASQPCTITFSQTAQPNACTLTFNDTPLLGTINVQKDTSTGAPLPGATFTLYTESGSEAGDSATAPDGDDTIAPATVAASVTCTTNLSGACSFTNVQLGSYEVFETTTPAGYETANEQDATVGLGSSPGTGQIQTLTFTDPYAPATIDVVKQDSNGNPLSGATFTLYAGSGTSGMVLGTCMTVTGGMGTCSFPNNLNKTEGTTFTIAETTAPNGYSAGSNQTFTINWSNSAQTITKTFTDNAVPGTIDIQKNDGNGKALLGAVFTLEQGGNPVLSGGNPVTCTTNGSGQCSFTSVALGTYTVAETTTPAGYQTAAPQMADVVLGSSPGVGDTISLTFSDPYAPATIKVVKDDASTPPVGLSGATFTLYAGSNTSGTQLGTCTTDSTGGCGLGNLNVTQGTTFTMAETTAPNGYFAASPETFTVTWGNTSQTITETFIDTPVPGTIDIQKNDANGKGLDGAVFTLSGGPTSGSCTTSGGACQFTNVALGTYTVTETTTPAGYETALPQQVTVGLGSAPGVGQTKTLTFTDPYAPATISVIKTDASTPPNPLSGATFDLYAGGSATGTALGTCTTDGTGGCSFPNALNIAQGSQFTVAETTAPDGYFAASPETFTVTWSNTSQTIPETFIDTPVPGTINILKTDDASPPNVLQGATFTLEQGGKPVTSSGGDPVTCTTLSDGTCSFQNVPLGNYTVVETTTPPGHQTAAPVPVTIVLGTAPGVGETVPLTIIDPRLHKVIVLVCSEGTNTLDGSSVSFDGGNTTQQSLDTGATLPNGVTEAELCGLGGATKSDLPEGALSPNVQINVQ